MRLAIVKLSAMGDIIHAMVTLQYIKQLKPSISIDWIVEERFAPILENNPHIDNILTINLKSTKKNKRALKPQIDLIKEYAKNDYDLAIDAQGLLKSASVARILSKNRAGFSYSSIRESLASLLYNTTVKIPYHANTIDRNAKVLSEPLGIDITKQMILDKEPFLYYDGKPDCLSLLSNEKKNIIFTIGSTWESRNYPKEKYTLLANLLQENILISWGNEEEHKKAQWIEQNSPYATAMPKTNLNDLKAIIANSDLLIGNDTGPTHIAWALNIPSITIFGPTPTNRVYTTDINKTISSSSKVDHYKLDKNDFSIQTIDPQDISTIATELLYL